jgi:ATP synthase protein I
MAPEKEPRFKPIIEGAQVLSLGISMVVAVLTGILIGYGLRRLFHLEFLFWLGVFFGIAAAFLNVYKVASKQYREFEEMAKDPKYRAKKYLGAKDDDDEEDEIAKEY